MVVFILKGGFSLEGEFLREEFSFARRVSFSSLVIFFGSPAASLRLASLPLASLRPAGLR